MHLLCVPIVAPILPVSSFDPFHINYLNDGSVSSYSEMMFHFHMIALEVIFAFNKKRILHICRNF